MKIKSPGYDYGPIGQRIKQTRRARRFTQEYVAERLNVSCQHISDIERGLNGMAIPSLMERVLEVGANYILFDAATGKTDNPISSLINKMNPQQSACAEEILTAYAKSCGIV